MSLGHQGEYISDRIYDVLERILPKEQDFKFRMNFQSGTLSDFYFRDRHLGVNEDEYQRLVIRNMYLDKYPEDIVLVMPEGESLVQEGINLLCQTWDFLPNDLLSLTRRLSPDLVFLLPYKGSYRIVASAVAFPSKWDPKEKIGRMIEESHSVVPHLNENLGKNIIARLNAMKESETVYRYNLGLSPIGTLNQHPKRNVPSFKEKLSRDRLFTRFFLRIEEQALTKLPHGLLFGIQVHTFESLDLFNVEKNVNKAKSIYNGLQHWLDTMPQDVAEYKGIDSESKKMILEQIDKTLKIVG